MIIDFHKLFVLVGDFELIEAGEPDSEALFVLFEADLLFDILFLVSNMRLCGPIFRN